MLPSLRTPAAYAAVVKFGTACNEPVVLFTTGSYARASRNTCAASSGAVGFR